MDVLIEFQPFKRSSLVFEQELQNKALITEI